MKKKLLLKKLKSLIYPNRIILVSSESTRLVMEIHNKTIKAVIKFVENLEV